MFKTIFFKTFFENKYFKEHNKIHNLYFEAKLCFCNNYLLRCSDRSKTCFGIVKIHL